MKKQKDEVELSKKELVVRAKDIGRENLKILYGIVKVIGLTTATIVLLNILFAFKGHFFDFSKIENFYPSNIWNWHWGNQDHLVFDTRIFCWVASCMVLILTYDAAMFATIFLYRISNGLEIILVFSFVGFEFFLFAILYPNFFIEKDNLIAKMLHEIATAPNIITERNNVIEIIKNSVDKETPIPYFASYWFIIYACYTICIGILAFIAIGKSKQLKLYHARINRALRRHYSYDFIETMTVGVINLVIGFVSLSKSSSTIQYSRFTAVNSFVPMVLIFIAYKCQYIRRDRITDKFLEKMDPVTIENTISFIGHYLKVLIVLRVKFFKKRIMRLIKFFSKVFQKIRKITIRKK